MGNTLWPSEEVRQTALNLAWDTAPITLSREESDQRCELQREALVLTALDLTKGVTPEQKTRLYELMRQGFGLYPRERASGYERDRATLIAEGPEVWEKLILDPLE